jgi:hypothetical protein
MFTAEHRALAHELLAGIIECDGQPPASLEEAIALIRGAAVAAARDKRRGAAERAAYHEIAQAMVPLLRQGGLSRAPRTKAAAARHRPLRRVRAPRTPRRTPEKRPAAPAAREGGAPGESPDPEPSPVLVRFRKTRAWALLDPSERERVAALLAEGAAACVVDAVFAAAALARNEHPGIGLPWISPVIPVGAVLVRDRRSGLWRVLDWCPDDPAELPPQTGGAGAA